MDEFLGEDWGLTTLTACDLYKDVVLPLRKDKGIIDLHTHFSPQELATNQNLKNAWRAMVFDPTVGNCDHYATGLAADMGVPFDYLYDESVPDEERFQKWADALDKLDGTQVHLFTHLELKRLFGITDLLSGANAKELFAKITADLQTPELSPHQILKKSDIRVVATTDDPLYDMAWHKQIKIDGVQVLPTFRPDAAVNIEVAGWKEYVQKLLGATKSQESLDGLVEALEARHTFFAENGCRSSDHGMRIPYGWKPNESTARAVFEAAMSGCEMTEEWVGHFKSYMMDKLIAMNKKKGMTTHLHIGILRDVNGPLFDHHKKDRGGDMSTHLIPLGENLAHLLGQHASGVDADSYGKIVLYHANSALNSSMAQLIRVFPGTYKGTTWWWLDSFGGMLKDFEETVPVIGFGKYSGFANDGRKLFSAYRGEVCARALCEYVGREVEAGRIHIDKAPERVCDVLYNTAHKLLFK